MGFGDGHSRRCLRRQEGVGEGLPPVRLNVEPVTQEDQGPDPVRDRVVHPPDQGPAIPEPVDDPHVPQRQIRRQWLLHDMADGGVKAGLVAGRGRIDMVQVPREIRVRGLDPDRSAKPDAASIEVLMEPGHPIQPLGDHREQLVVRGRGALGHSDGADRDRRPLPLHLQPDEVEGVESVSAIGHGPMVPPGPAARQGWRCVS